MSNNNIKIPIEGTVENVNLIEGLYEDMWVGQKLVFSLQSSYPLEGIELQGYLSNQFPEENHFCFQVNDIEKQASFPADQMFQYVIPVKIHPQQIVTVTVKSEQVLNLKKQGLGGDERDLSFLLLKCGVQQGKTAGEYLKVGMHHQMKGEFDEAVNCYQKAIDWNPNFHWSYLKLGEVLERLGHFEESKKYIYRAIHLNPNLSTFSNLSKASLN
jgi:tetratricopeptide (TPR) repeat protein